MKAIRSITLVISLIVLALSSYAQPGGGRRPGGGPEEMVAREKQAIYEKITDLSDDQKLLIEGVYDEFAVTLREGFQEARESNDREGRREKMEALRKEKDELIADILNTEQYEIYQSITATRRDRKDKPGNSEE